MSGHHLPILKLAITGHVSNNKSHILMNWTV